jgi:hypothetical protein
MFQKVVGAALVLAVSVGFGLAEEIRAVIIKVDGNKVTFAENKSKEKGKVDKGPEKTLPAADNVKVLKSKFNQETKKVEAGDALDSGLKNEVFSKIGENGLRATVITDADNKKITEIRVRSQGFLSADS